MGNRRIGAAIILACLVSGGLSIRLFSLSVVQHDRYFAQAQKNQEAVLDIQPRRGEIYVQDAASGRPTLIAKSVERYALTATPVNVKKKAEYAKVLAKHSGVDEKTVLERLETDLQYMNPLKHGLTKEQAEAVSADLNAVEKAANPSWTTVGLNFDAAQGNIIFSIGGVLFVKEYQRTYPEGGMLSQTLGFVNNQGVGQYGFEGQYDEQLKGYEGQLRFEKDSIGTLLDQTSSIEGQDGTNYVLSIDRNIQYVVEKELAAEIEKSEAKGGTVIVMNPKTGEVVAMASSPTYDANNFRDVKQEEIGLFDNPAISKIWEPGSIFKPLVMAAALDQGLVTPQTKETFEASVTVEGHKIETALRKAYGVETMNQVLANSDNVAMVWVANKLGNQTMYDYLTNFGFGSRTGVDLKNEISGSVLPVDKWRDINRATISFGQGIAVTPLQITAAYAAIANDGKMVKPRIVSTIKSADGTDRQVETSEGIQVVSPETAKELRDMMVYTVVNAHSRAGTEGYKIGGKTGTAQVPDPEKGGYIEDAYNHSFVGFGPSDDPKYVMLVKIDQPNLEKVGIYAEGTAVPLFGRISTFLLNYYQIPPTNR